MRKISSILGPSRRQEHLVDIALVSMSISKQQIKRVVLDFSQDLASKFLA
jgi:hypothetical protein